MPPPPAAVRTHTHTHTNTHTCSTNVCSVSYKCKYTHAHTHTSCTQTHVTERAQPLHGQGIEGSVSRPQACRPGAHACIANAIQHQAPDMLPTPNKAYCMFTLAGIHVSTQCFPFAFNAVLYQQCCTTGWVGRTFENRGANTVWCVGRLGKGTRTRADTPAL